MNKEVESMLYENLYQTRNTYDLIKLEDDFNKVKVKCPNPKCDVTTIMTNTDKVHCYKCGHLIRNKKAVIEKMIKVIEKVGGKNEK